MLRKEWQGGFTTYMQFDVFIAAKNIIIVLLPLPLEQSL
jgi:hypothetical protein